MTKVSIPRGVYAAAVTPMAKGGESVDIGGVGPLLDYLARRGITGILTLGTTGEFASLSLHEKLELIAESASTRGPLKLIVGCGSPALPETLELMETAARRGATAVLVPPPFYFRNASAKGIENWFNIVLERSNLPVILYHIPAMTALPLDRKMLERLAEKHSNLWGIKDSGGKIQETCRYIAGKPGKVLLGSDSSALAGLQAGAVGLITACANIVPELISRIYARYIKGEIPEDDATRLADIRTFLRQFPLHASLKFWLKCQGIQVGDVRPPLLTLSSQEEDELMKFIKLHK